MGLGESIRLAFEGLRANKMRAVLTMLGIVVSYLIGVVFDLLVSNFAMS